MGFREVLTGPEPIARFRVFSEAHRESPERLAELIGLWMATVAGQLFGVEAHPTTEAKKLLRT